MVVGQDYYWIRSQVGIIDSMLSINFSIKKNTVLICGWRGDLFETLYRICLKGILEWLTYYYDVWWWLLGDNVINTREGYKVDNLISRDGYESEGGDDDCLEDSILLLDKFCDVN